MNDVEYKKKIRKELIGNIVRAFENYNDDKLEVFVKKTLYLDDLRYCVPDIMFVSKNKKIIRDDGVHGTPEVIVQIATKDTRKQDYICKFDDYKKIGVKQYCIIDLTDEITTVYYKNDDYTPKHLDMQKMSDDEIMEIIVKTYDDLTKQTENYLVKPEPYDRMKIENTEHNRLVVKLLHDYTNDIKKDENNMEVFTGEALFFKNRYFVPDIMIVHTDNICYDGVRGIPETIVEVVSENTRTEDYTYKLEEYKKIGVKKYCIWDLTDELVTEYLKDNDYVPKRMNLIQMCQ